MRRSCLSKFVNTVRQLAELIVDIQVADWDVVLVVTGTAGVGKSVFMFWLLHECYAVMRERGIAEIYFNPVRDLWFSRDEVNDWLDDSPRFSSGAADEGVGMFYSRDYHEPEQKALLKKMDRMREEKNFVFSILLPNFFSLDSHIRNGRISYWVNLDSRKGKGQKGYAHGVVYQKDENNFSKDPWNLSLNTRLFRQKRLDKSPNYVGEIYFNDLPPEWKKVYKMVKKEKRLLAELDEWAQAKKLGRGSL